MTTQNVKNNHDSPLSIGGVIIAANSTGAVPNWEYVKETRIVVLWLQLGIIEAEGESPSLPGMESSSESTNSDEDAEKERIIAELHELGIEKTKRTSLENLRKALAEAKGGDGSTPAPTGGLPGMTSGSGDGSTPAPTGGLPGVPAT